MRCLLLQDHQVVLELLRVLDRLALQQVDVGLAILVGFHRDIVHKVHRREVKAEDLLNVRLSLVRKLDQGEHFNLHLDEAACFGVLFCLFFEVDVAAYAHDKLVLIDAPQLQCLVGDCTLVHAHACSVEDFYQIVTLQSHLVDEVVV